MYDFMVHLSFHMSHCQSWYCRSGIWLEDLFVLPEHRKHGFGKALIQEVRRLTDGRVEWAVLDWNEPSIKFYESLGAKKMVGWGTFRWDPLEPSSAN
jgi:GNAT superfamily N-acetyltransferase